MQYGVSMEKGNQLVERMERLGIRESDLEESFIRGSGSGGQKINKTSSTVVIVHKPSGIEVRCQRERSQAMNRFFARRDLCDRMEEKTLGEASKRQQAIEKIRRQKRKRSKRAKARMVEGKRIQGAKKELRGRVSSD